MPEYATPDIWIRGGLLDAKHYAAMGESIWLYLYLHSIVRFSGDAAGHTPEELPYRHTEAAAQLGFSLRTIKYQFDRLVSAGYVSVSRRRAHGLDVTITKYGDVAGRAAARKRSQVQPVALHIKEGLVQSTALDDVQPAARLGSQSSAIRRQVKCNPASSQVQPVALVTNKDARAPLPSPPLANDSNGQVPQTPSWRTELAEAFTARGLGAPNLDGNEGITARKLLKDNPPDLLARCWQDIAAGVYGNDWLHDNLSFVTLYERERFNNWLREKAGMTRRPQKKTPMTGLGRVITGLASGRSQRALTSG